MEVKTEKPKIDAMSDMELIGYFTKLVGEVVVTEAHIEVDLPDSVDKITYNYIKGIYETTGRDNFWVEDKSGAHDYYLYFRRKK